MIGKLIVIEGTDCSGKETQSKKLIERLNQEGKLTEYICFPNYASSTGKIIGGPYLGKKHICEGWFKEGASNVDPKVASLYYAADRKYNLDTIVAYLNEGHNVILDRYFYSNMAHQGGKINNKKERLAMYQFIEKLEIDLLQLPVPEIRIFLHVPYELSAKLKQGRLEEADQHEMFKEHLIHAEQAYLEVADLYNFKTIQCDRYREMKSIDEINEEIYQYVKSQLEH